MQPSSQLQGTEQPDASLCYCRVDVQGGTGALSHSPRPPTSGTA